MSFLTRSIATLFCCLLAASSQRVSAQSAERIRAAVESGNWETARSEINKFQGADAAGFQSKGYDYLLGRIAEKTGDITAATANYQSVLSRDTLLSEYALWRLARIARSTGDLVLERERLRRLVTTAPTSLVYDAAVLRLAESYFESEDFQAAADSIRPLTQSTKVALSRQAAVLMGTAYVRAGKEPEAREVFTKLVMQMPDASQPDDFALAAVRELDALDKKSAKRASLSEADHLLRASIYQFNRDFAGARVHYQDILDGNPQSGTVPNATYQLGRGLYLEGKYIEAIKSFQRVSDQYPQTPSARDALSYLASSYLRLKRPEDAIAAYKRYIDRYPDAPNPERPYLNIIDALHEAGRYAEALSWVQQTRARFKNTLGGALALFAQLRIHLALAGWSDVVRDADELLKASDLGGVKVPGGTNPMEVTFLRAYALEMLGRTDDAVTAYLSIPDGRNEYYGARSTQRLLALASNDKARGGVQSQLNFLLNAARSAIESGQFEQGRIAAQSSLRLTSDLPRRAQALKYLRAAYESLPAYRLQTFSENTNEWSTMPVADNKDEGRHQTLANNLGQLGLYDEAVPELLAARTSGNTTTKLSGGANASQISDIAYMIASLSLRAELAYRAVRFGEQLWKTVPADFVLELAPRELLEFLYPAPFRESLLKNTSSRNVDPRFILSIARQESRYQVDAKSAAAARGMMQFIPATANEIATQLKLQSFEQDDLYYADTAILFGSQYLSNLFQQFPNQPQAVAAAYNGGAENVTRWIGRARATEADRYVPEIGFSQSKDYVYKVMTNYWNYQKLYDAQLQTKSSFTSK
jgi:soluble lytic murein transglycosylase-like protein/TolA-binding protein